MKLSIKLLLLIAILSFNSNCQRDGGLLTDVSPQPKATLENVNSRDLIDEELKRAIEKEDNAKIAELLPKVAEPVLLIKAIREKNVDKVKDLLQNGANPNSIVWSDLKPLKDYQTALWEALVSENEEILELLLQYKADINKVSAHFEANTDKKGWVFSSAVHTAVLKNPSDVETIKFLVAHGASLKSEKNLLFYARGEEMVKYLVENGVDINEKYNDEIPLLIYWNAEPNLDAVRLYLKYGANPYLKDNRGKTVFDEIQSNKNLSSAEKKQAIQLMKEHGAKFLSPTAKQNTEK